MLGTVVAWAGSSSRWQEGALQGAQAGPPRAKDGRLWDKGWVLTLV